MKDKERKNPLLPVCAGVIFILTYFIENRQLSVGNTDLVVHIVFSVIYYVH